MFTVLGESLILLHSNLEQLHTLGDNLDISRQSKEEAAEVLWVFGRTMDPAALGEMLRVICSSLYVLKTKIPDPPKVVLKPLKPPFLNGVD